MEEEELRLCSPPPRSRCRRDSPPGPWRGERSLSAPGEAQMPLVLYQCLKNKLAAGPRLHRPHGASSLRTCCLCPLAASTAQRGLPVSLEAIAARGGGMAAPGHADPLHPWLVWFPGAGEFLALSPVEDGTGRAWVALQHILLWGPSLVLLIWETHIAAQPRLLHVSLPSAGQSPRFPAMCRVLVGQGCPPGTRHTAMWGSRWYWWGRSSWSRPCGMMPHGQAGG